MSTSLPAVHIESSDLRVRRQIDLAIADQSHLHSRQEGVSGAAPRTGDATGTTD